MNAKARSELMSRIRGKNTQPELQIRKYLWHAGFRYRLHAPSLPGKPDLVFPKWNAVVFVHGCFWHRHEGCPYFRLPKTRPEFWDKKLSRNSERDLATLSSMGELGWRVALVWECAIRTNLEGTGQTLATWLAEGEVDIQIEGKKNAVHSSRLPDSHEPCDPTHYS